MRAPPMTQPKESFIPTRWSLISRLKDWDDGESWKLFFDSYWKLIYSVALKAGLRESEAEHYEPSQDFSSVEANYRKGFEAALERRNQGKNFDQALPNLAARFPVICYTKEFRAGYERGQKHGPEERSATILI